MTQPDDLNEITEGAPQMNEVNPPPDAPYTPPPEQDAQEEGTS